MILAAGRGTRLRPLTNDRPKALVNAGGVPLLELAIRRLIHFGCRDIIVNVHHFGEQIIEFLQEKDSFGINIQISDEREQLLDTGGALKKAADFFADGQPFLLYNTDIITDLQLGFDEFDLSAILTPQSVVSTRATAEGLELVVTEPCSTTVIALLEGVSDPLFAASAGVAIATIGMMKLQLTRASLSSIDLFMVGLRGIN